MFERWRIEPKNHNKHVIGGQQKLAWLSKPAALDFK